MTERHPEEGKDVMDKNKALESFETPAELKMIEELLTQITTILTLCVSKGLFTEEEYNKALSIVTAKCDQKFEKVRQDAISEYLESEKDE